MQINRVIGLFVTGMQTGCVLVHATQCAHPNVEPLKAMGKPWTHMLCKDCGEVVLALALMAALGVVDPMKYAGDP